MLALVMGLMGLGLLLWPRAGGDVHVARGTVVQAVECGPPDAHDRLSVELLDGRVVPARLDGCGHRPGDVLTVEVSDPPPSGEVVARLPGTGVPVAAAQGQRFAAVGVAVAGIAGALLVWRLRSRPS